MGTKTKYIHTCMICGYVDDYYVGTDDSNWACAGKFEPRIYNTFKGCTKCSGNIAKFTKNCHNCIYRDETVCVNEDVEIEILKTMQQHNIIADSVKIQAKNKPNCKYWELNATEFIDDIEYYKEKVNAKNK